MNDYPKISIITPNLNGERYLERCIRSVLDQDYPNLDYIIIDGGSTDKSPSIISKYLNRISYYESQSDDGMYFAIQKGFDLCSGEVMGWLNSDDRYWQNSLHTVAEIFSCHPDVQWLQGYPVVIDDSDRIVHHRSHAFSKLSFYLKEYRKGLFIQQESTFWKRSLWNKAGGSLSTRFNYAADFELWMRFFNHEPLFITDAVLGAFRMHKGDQISKIHYDKYLEECDQIINSYFFLLTQRDKKNLDLVIKLKWFEKQFPFIYRSLHFDTLVKKILGSPNKIKFNFSTFEF